MNKIDKATRVWHRANAQERDKLLDAMLINKSAYRNLVCELARKYTV